MTVTIPLSSAEEQALLRKAAALGLDPAEYVRTLVADATHVGTPNGSSRHPAAQLLAHWLAVDATDDPDALLVAERDLVGLKAGLNANRAGQRPLF